MKNREFAQSLSGRGHIVRFIKFFKNVEDWKCRDNGQREAPKKFVSSQFVGLRKKESPR